MSKENPLTDEQYNKIIELFNMGWGERRISKILNLTRGKIISAFIKLNLKTSSRPGKMGNGKDYSNGKQCNECLIIKPVDQFRVHKRTRKINSRWWYEPMCKNCEDECYRESYEKNKLIWNSPEYQNEHKDEIEKEKLIRKEPIHWLKRIISRAVYGQIKSNGGSKNKKSIMKYLPYTIEELKEYIEQLFSHSSNLTPDGQVWMSWENRGRYFRSKWNDNDPSTWVWNLDHRIPQSDLPYISMEEENFQKTWKLDNLRPYSAKQNLLDGALRIRHKINLDNSA